MLIFIINLQSLAAYIFLSLFFASYGLGQPLPYHYLQRQSSYERGTLTSLLLSCNISSYLFMPFSHDTFLLFDAYALWTFLLSYQFLALDCLANLRPLLHFYIDALAMHLVKLDILSHILVSQLCGLLITFHVDYFLSFYAYMLCSTFIGSSDSIRHFKLAIST